MDDDDQEETTELERYENAVKDIRARFETALEDWGQLMVPDTAAERELTHLKFSHDQLTTENIQLMKNNSQLQILVKSHVDRIRELNTTITKLRALNDDLQTTVRAVRAALVDRGEL